MGDTHIGDNMSVRCSVIKRDGTSEPFSKDKLIAFLEELMFDLDAKHVKTLDLVDGISKAISETIKINDLYEFVAELAASRTIVHPDYSVLAGRVEAIKIQKTVGLSFSSNIQRLYDYRTRVKVQSHSLLSESLHNIVTNHKELFDKAIDATKDLSLSYFGIKTLEKSYLLSIDGNVAETPQFLFMRVAIGIHGNDLESVFETYDLMSSKYFIHASPTLFNAGTDYNYLSSCFLLAMEDDSIDGIYKTLHKTAMISKASGGIGIHMHNIRASGSIITSSNGRSSGLVPMLRVFNNTARYVDQGGNKRPGAFAVYLEPWHADIMEILDLKKNYGKEEMRARDLFYGLWIPDLFMKKVKEDEDWCLFSPDEAPGLHDCYGEEFEQLYYKYVSEGKARVVMKAQKLWLAILQSQTETGGPYILFKDACNKKSNQKNLGVIKSSNLCCEIVEYSSPTETAVCNLGSLALPSFVKENEDTVGFDLVKLHQVTKVLAKNLDKVIDVTKYPVETAKTSNLKHRPIAVGVQGLADVFLLLRLPFESQEAKNLNIQIFETIYHASVEASIELAEAHGHYETFKDSPTSKGLLQFDLWNHKPSGLYEDWDELKSRILKTGIRNSLLVAPMPTASTSQILGYNECFEPFTSNIYTRRVISGEFQVVNKYLIKDLIDLGIWNKSMKEQILFHDGSIQNISEIPADIKALYKTVWEISQRVIIDMAADRGRFIDQLQSMNIHMKNPSFGKLTSCHFHAWEQGLKTGMYYLRTLAPSRAIQFTVDHLEIPTSTETKNKLPDLKRKRYSEAKGSFKPLKISKTEYVTPVSGILSPDYTLSREDSQNSIYDETIRNCDINQPENCDSCSG